MILLFVDLSNRLLHAPRAADSVPVGIWSTTGISAWVLRRRGWALSFWLVAALGWAGEDVNEDDFDDETVEVSALPERIEDDLTCLHYEEPGRERRGTHEVRLLSDIFWEHEGKTIRFITHESRDIFDETNPDEDNWLYRAFNRLHINTRERTVLAQLLFDEGDPVNTRQIKETERILRSRSYLTSAYIVPGTICDEYVDVHVVTRDAWVTEPEFAFGHEGGDTRSGFGVKDGNFLGTGDNISIGYSQDQQRSSINYDYRTSHLFNTRLSARAFFADKSDGRDRILSLEKPFYSLDTPWAAGFVNEDVSEIHQVRARGDVINEFRHRFIDNHFYVGIGTTDNEDHTQRWLLGFTHEEDRFSENEDTVLGIPDERKAYYPWWEYQYIENSYAVYRNIHQIQRDEDLATGVNFRLRMGYGGNEFNNDTDIFRYLMNYSNMLDFGDQHLLRLGFSADGRYYPQVSGTNSYVLGTTAAYHYFVDNQSRWYIGAELEFGRRLQQYEELTVGGASGLRGYPADYQRGSKRYVFTLERRYFSNVHLFNVVRMGFVGFFDMGMAWGGEEGLDNSHLANVGMGVRLSSSKARIGNVLHVDVATPMMDRSGLDRVQLSVKASSRF